MITVLVIAHRVHFNNWRKKYPIEGKEFVLVDSIEKLDGHDPQSTYILPLFMNNRNHVQYLEEIFDVGSLTYRIIKEV